MLNVSLLTGLIVDAIPGKGEDAVCSLVGERTALIACMDGCGGSGAQRYEVAGETCKGARIASHEVAEALKSFFDQSGIAQDGVASIGDDEAASCLKACIDARLADVCAALGDQRSRIKSKLSAVLPTTLALLLAEPVAQPDRVSALAMWAGDSRVYALLPEGLRQLSADDVTGGADAEDNLTDDGIMSNAVSASGMYHINTKRVELRGSCMLLTATDGCFAYFPSPILFEGALLETLEAANTPAEWMDSLSERLGQIASDDYSLQLAAFTQEGETFFDLKRRYARRMERYRRDYGEPIRRLISDGDREGMRALWKNYREQYYAK